MAPTNELAPKTGKVGTLITGEGSLRIHVRILDSRVSYGRDQYYVTPVAGDGEKWVDALRVVDVQDAAWTALNEARVEGL
jgi:hypothetical protein